MSKIQKKPRAGQSSGFLQGLIAAAPGLVVTLIIAAIHIWQPSALSALGNLVFDSYQRIWPRPYEEAPVRVVDIDDETIRRLGQWPWPRTDTARLTQALADAGASAIAFDVVFSEPDRTSPARAVEIIRRNPEARGDYADIAALADHDALFGQTMGAAPTVAGYFMTLTPNKARPFEPAGVVVSGTPPMEALPAFRGAIPTLPAIAGKAAGAGFVNVLNSRDGIIRNAPLVARIDDRIVPSLSLEALRVAQQAGAIMVKSSDASGEVSGGQVSVLAVKAGQFEVPTTRDGALWMHYTDERPERIVPAWKILTGALPPEEMSRLFEGHVVFVGAGAVGLRDLVSTPLRERELGVIVHAQAAEQMILGKFLSRPDWALGLERVLLLLFGIGLAILAPTLGALRSGLIAAASLAGTVAGSWLSFRYSGLLIEPVIPVLTIVLVYTMVTSFSFYREERSRAYIRRAFDRYLSPELVERIARDPGQLELGGEERDMTVLFSDIRSFSRISEKMAPQELISFLIELLTPLTDALLARKATIDKYIGDAVLAFWNAPLDDPDQYRNAAHGALDMIQALKEMNARQTGLVGPWPGDVAIGIGLNAGRCCVGNMGSRQRLSYSLIGDAVNLASRLEGLTKVYGVPILMGATLAREIPEFAQIEVDQVRVVGRDAPERIHALLGDPIMAGDKDFRVMKTAFAAMLEAYRNRDWEAAENALAIAKGAGSTFGIERLAALFAERIARYRDHPPPEDWDGVYLAEEK
ncbi:MAG TPA: adenylate/guanylate cyclase domain-containing protein [Caulobacter sp.]|nr:adenylate/guanylate cyclase domain-containing protein [Caulobacter sp.]